MYKNIIFDVGQVLFDYDWVGALIKSGVPNDEAYVLQPGLFNDSLWADLDLQNRPYFDTVDMICTKYHEYAGPIRTYFTKVDMLPIDRPDVWIKVHELKEKGYKIYLLSNYSEYMFKIHTEGKAFMNDLDGMMVSYMVHANKPDPQIYEALLSKYGLNASECIFFDDKEENTQGARNCGIDAVTVPTKEFLLSELNRLLV